MTRLLPIIILFLSGCIEHRVYEVGPIEVECEPELCEWGEVHYAILRQRQHVDLHVTDPRCTPDSVIEVQPAVIWDQCMEGVSVHFVDEIYLDGAYGLPEAQGAYMQALRRIEIDTDSPDWRPVLWHEMMLACADGTPDLWYATEAETVAWYQCEGLDYQVAP